MSTVHHGLFLDPDNSGNKEWYHIYNYSGELIEKIDKVHKGLEGLKIPKFLPFRLKRELDKLRKAYYMLTPDFNAWWQRARIFTEKPEINVTVNIQYPMDQIVGYLHYLLVIINRIAALEGKMNNTIRDFNLYWLTLKSIESQFWATIYFTISILITVIISIISIVITI
jgi:hypothetical protein